MLIPRSRNTMNERVITGNHSFSSRWGASPAPAGVRPPSSPFRNHPKSPPSHPVPSKVPFHPMTEGEITKLPLPELAQAFHKVLEPSIEAFTQERFVAKGPFFSGASPFRRRSQTLHLLPYSNEKRSKGSLDPHHTYRCEKHPLQPSQTNRVHALFSFAEKWSDTTQITRGSLARSSRLQTHQPIQGFGK